MKMVNLLIYFLSYKQERNEKLYMHFSNSFEDDEEYNIIECTKLDNNILVYKQKLDENQHYVVKLKQNQCAVLFEKGQIFDMIKEEGVYTIKTEPNTSFPEELIDYQIKDNQDHLCVLFFNMDIITGNKFYIKKKLRKDFFGEGTFDFAIEKPLKLFNKVIQVRSYYSREELLEQIREKISKIVTSVIKDQPNAYIIEEEVINSSINIFKEYGIKILSSNIKNIEFKKK